MLGIDDVRTLVNRMHGDIIDRTMPTLKFNIHDFSRRMIRLILCQPVNQFFEPLLDKFGENDIAS